MLVPPPCAPSTSPFTITPLPRRVLSPSPSLACLFPPHALPPLPPSLSFPFLVVFSPLPLARVHFPPPCAPSTSPFTITPLPRRVLSPSPSLACLFPPHALPPLPPSLSLPFLVAFSPLPLASVLVPPPCARSTSPITRACSPPMRSLHFPRHYHSPSSSRSLPFPSLACLSPPHALAPLPPSLSLPFLVAFYPLPLASVLLARSPPMRSLHFPLHYHSPSSSRSIPFPSLACSFPPHALPPLPPSLSLPFLVAFYPLPLASVLRARSPPMRSLHFPRHYHSPSSSCSIPFPLLACSFSPHALPPLPPSLPLPFLVAFYPLPLASMLVPPPCAPSTSPVTVTPLPRHVLSPSPSRTCTIPSHALPPLPPSQSQ
ncbi:unnamed protein product [Closterium sp. Naga37s-1]|nr:unnamed protein product [Closterium sp. Naga37s-1]